jgi:peptidyl-prolyl cis-trans isomerase C
LTLAWTCAIGVSGCSKPPSVDGAGETGSATKGKAKPEVAKETPEQKKLMRVSALGPLPAGPVARVAGEDITLADFRGIYDLKLKKFEGKGRNMTKRVDARYRRSITERLIRQDIIEREAKALGVEYKEEDLSEKEADSRRRVRDWEKDLGRRGESNETLRKLEITRLRESAILAKTVDLTVTDAEVEEEYERIKTNFDKDTDRYRLYRVVFESEEFGSPEKAKEKALEFRKLALESEEDFLSLGQKHSKSLVSGDLGLRRADRLEERIMSPLAKMETGAISEPLEIPQGFELVKHGGKWGPGILPMDALIDMLHSSLVGRKRQDKGVELMEKLYEKYEVENLMEKTIEASGGPSKPAKRPPKPVGTGKTAEGAPPAAAGKGAKKDAPAGK